MKLYYAIPFFLLAAFSLEAQIIHIPSDQPTIQAGIDVATDGDTVLVADSTYYENINFKGKAITVASQFILDGDTSYISKTIIDGSQYTHADSASTVMLCSGEDTASVLMGFTITGGKGSHFHAWWGDTREFDFGGGGIAIVDCGGKICHNIIEGHDITAGSRNDFNYAGGIYANVNHNHSAIIRNNIIRNNRVTGKYTYGAAMLLVGGRLIVENNTLVGNDLHGQEYAIGSAIYWANWGSEGVINDVVFRNNLIAENRGITNVHSGYGGTLIFGGSLENKRVQVYNNLITDNFNDCIGGAMYIMGARITMMNNTMWNNEAGLASNNIRIEGPADVVMFNNIVASYVENDHHDFQILTNEDGSFLACHNLLKEPFTEEEKVSAWNNTYLEPVFKPDSYELADRSPGIGQGADTLLVEDNWYYAPTFDIYGNPRPHPIDNRVDMGAIESPYEGFVYIPDTAFLNALIYDGVDTNGDSLISYAEAEAVTSLDVSCIYYYIPEVYRHSIKSLEGIEAFINLDSLSCNTQDSLTELDLSNNPNLKYLSCDAELWWVVGAYFGDLESLDISNNSLLKTLNCTGNQLTTLDISKNTALEHLVIEGMPMLYEVCVWEGFSDDIVDSEGSPNVCFETDCNGVCENTVTMESAISRISVYPNPAYTLLTIATEQQDHYSVVITSLNGQLIYDEIMEGTAHHLDLSSFQKGIYLITIKSEDFVTTRKIIKL